jgi:hypothetical protein
MIQLSNSAYIYQRMKRHILFIAVLALACKNEPKTSPLSGTDTVNRKNHLPDNRSHYYIATDSIVLSSPHFDTLVYSKKDFNEIVDHFPDLYSPIPVHPDISYAQSGYFKEFTAPDSSKTHISFGSEAGQDNYYILYAYFLKKQNQGAEAATRRETLIAIYQDLNSIFGYLQHGGTFFGHQYNRINGYAEYGVYQYLQYKDLYSALPDITKQKNLYIASLKQVVTDHIHTDNEIPDQRSKETNKAAISRHIDHLDKLITDNFYLKKAQEFQYSCY